VTEYVAVLEAPADRARIYHDLDDDGEVPFPASATDGVEFRTVPLGTVRSDLDPCQHCSGEIEFTGGQGSEPAAKLAATDPDEVSTP
jgi:hypothetical protein